MDDHKPSGFFKTSRLVLLGISLQVLSGCNETPTTLNESRTFSLSIESPLPVDQTSSLQARNYDPASITPSVRLNGFPVEIISQGDGSYQVTASFSTNDVTVDVEWSQIFESAVLQLAIASKQFSVADGGRQSILMEDYNIGFDSDGDLDFNLDELKNGYNPRNSNSCTRCRADIASHVDRIPASQRPEINGQYDSIWDNAQFKDVNGEAVLDQVENDDDRVFRFFTLHDDQNFYLYVQQDIERGSDVRLTDNMQLFVGFAGIDPEVQISDVFSPPPSAISSETSTYTFNLHNQDDEPYVEDLGTFMIGTNSVVVWEASFDLASIASDVDFGGEEAYNFSTDRFLLGIYVTDFSGEIIQEWGWEGLITLNQ